MDVMEPPENGRFCQIDAAEFVEQNENANTLKKTLGHIKLFREYLQSKGEAREMYNIPPNELEPLLSNFFVNVRTKDGGEYEPTTLRSMLGSFERFLRRHDYGYSVVGGKEFAKTKISKK